MHKYCTYVVKLLLSHNIQYSRGMYLLSLVFARKCMLHRSEKTLGARSPTKWNLVQQKLCEKLERHHT